jgi:hypothetical protein
LLYIYFRHRNQSRVTEEKSFLGTNAVEIIINDTIREFYW